uniref:Putative ovule protein n=1 Tax=Solanum chacoense TaxID=4108 RepID=A0A0V0GRJ6_SOLCH
MEKVQHATTKTKPIASKETDLLVSIMARSYMHLFKCWRRPEAKCSKCNQFGHEAIICKSKTQQQDVDA